MNRLRFGLIAGLVFGAIDVVPLFWMELPDRPTTLLGVVPTGRTIAVEEIVLLRFLDGKILEEWGH